MDKPATHGPIYAHGMHGLGDTADGWASLMPSLGLTETKFILPTATNKPITKMMPTIQAKTLSMGSPQIGATTKTPEICLVFRRPSPPLRHQKQTSRGRTAQAGRLIPPM